MTASREMEMVTKLTLLDELLDTEEKLDMLKIKKDFPIVVEGVALGLLSQQVREDFVPRVSDIKDKVIKWPDLEKHREIAETAETLYKIKNLIEFIDGTHVKLSAVLISGSHTTSGSGF